MDSPVVVAGFAPPVAAAVIVFAAADADCVVSPLHILDTRPSKIQMKLNINSCVGVETKLHNKTNSDSVSNFLHRTCELRRRM